MNERLWYEMINTKYGESYLSAYIYRQKTVKVFFKVVTIVLSASGILGWKFFEDYAWIAFVLIAVLQIISLVENQFIRSDNDIYEISKLRSMYTKYFNELEYLWTKKELFNIPEEEYIENFYELRKNYWFKIEELDTRMKIPFKRPILIKRANNQTNYYFNLYHKNGKAKQVK